MSHVCGEESFWFAVSSPPLNAKPNNISLLIQMACSFVIVDCLTSIKAASRSSSHIDSGMVILNLIVC